MTPVHPIWSARAVVVDPDYCVLDALKRDNVTLVTNGIERIEPRGIVATDGTLHQADVIVYATGFKATKVLFPLEIKGRGGIDLRGSWGERPAAYLGITVPQFPNLFLMYGPGTTLVHGASLIFHSECQIRYITGCIKTLVEGPHQSMEPRLEVHDEYYERTQRELDGLVWSHPSIRHSWFKNAEGRIHVLSPWRLVDYWAWTREPNLDDFVIH